MFARGKLLHPALPQNPPLVIELHYACLNGLVGLHVELTALEAEPAIAELCVGSDYRVVVLRQDLHLRDACLPGVHGGIGRVERPVPFFVLTLAEPHHSKHAREVRGEVLEHVGDPVGLAAAQLGAGNLGDKERLIDVCKSSIGLHEHLRKGLPVGPALTLAPVVTVNRNVVDVFIAWIVAGKTGSTPMVRGVGGPDPFYVVHIFFTENIHDVAVGLGDIGVSVPCICLAHSPVVPVAVGFVERPEPDFFAVVLDALCKFANVGVGFAVYDILCAVAVCHPSDNQRRAVILCDIGILFNIIPVVDVEQGKVADEVHVRALQFLKRENVFLCWLWVLARSTDPGPDLEC